MRLILQKSIRLLHYIIRQPHSVIFGNEDIDIYSCIHYSLFTSKKTIFLYKDLFKEGSCLFLDFYFSLFFHF